MLGHLDTTHKIKKRNLEALSSLFEKYEFGPWVTYIGGGLPSDNMEFARVRVPVATINTTGSRLYHTPGDDADTLDYAGIQKLADYAFDLIILTSGRAKDYKLWDEKK